MGRNQQQVERFESVSNALTGILDAAAPVEASTDWSEEWSLQRLKAYADGRGIDLFRRQKYKADVVEAIREADGATAADPKRVAVAIAVGRAVMDGMTLAAARAKVAATA